MKLELTTITKISLLDLLWQRDWGEVAKGLLWRTKHQSTIRNSFKELVYKHPHEQNNIYGNSLPLNKEGFRMRRERNFHKILPPLPQTDSSVWANFGIQRIFKKLPLKNY